MSDGTKEIKKMFTVQADRVLCTLARDGVYYVKKKLRSTKISGDGLDLPGSLRFFYSACI